MIEGIRVYARGTTSAEDFVQSDFSEGTQQNYQAGMLVIYTYTHTYKTFFKSCSPSNYSKWCFLVNKALVKMQSVPDSIYYGDNYIEKFQVALLLSDFFTVL